MPLVISIEIVVEAKVGIAGLEVAARAHPVVERPVDKEGEVESPSVPGDERRHPEIHQPEERFDEFLLARFRGAEGPDPDVGVLPGPRPAAQHAGHRHHPVQVQAQEPAAALLHPELAHGLGGARIVEALEPVQPPARLDVGHRLDIEREEILPFVAVVHGPGAPSSSRSESAYTRASSRPPDAAG